MTRQKTIHRLSFIVLLVFVVCSVPALASANNPSVECGFYVTDVQIGSSIVLYGTFYNNSPNIDIANLCEFSLAVYDRTGHGIASIYIDSEPALDMILVPSGGVIYQTLTLPLERLLNPDVQAMDLSGGFVTRNSFSYKMYACAGANVCKLCAPYRAIVPPVIPPAPVPDYEPQPQPVPVPVPTYNPQPRTCTLCSGTGIRTCMSCWGAGNIAEKEIVTPYYGGDTSNERVRIPQKCLTCNGKGQIVCYLCNGKGEK